MESSCRRTSALKNYGRRSPSRTPARGTRPGSRTGAPHAATSTAARSPSGERAHRRGSRSGAAFFPGVNCHKCRRHRPLRSIQKREEKELSLGFPVGAGRSRVLLQREDRTAVESDPTAIGVRPATGPDLAQEGERRAPRRAGLVARSSTAGPRAQAREGR